jgi:hypothetical protein
MDVRTSRPERDLVTPTPDTGNTTKLAGVVVPIAVYSLANIDCRGISLRMLLY